MKRLSLLLLLASICIFSNALSSRSRLLGSYSVTTIADDVQDVGYRGNNLLVVQLNGTLLLDSGSGFTTLAASPETFTAVDINAQGNACGVGTSGTVYYRSAAGTYTDYLASNATDCSLADDQSIYYIGTSGTIFERHNNSWVATTQTGAKKISAYRANNFYFVFANDTCGSYNRVDGFQSHSETCNNVGVNSDNYLTFTGSSTIKIFVPGSEVRKMPLDGDFIAGCGTPDLFYTLQLYNGARNLVRYQISGTNPPTSTSIPQYSTYDINGNYATCTVRADRTGGLGYLGDCNTNLACASTSYYEWVLKREGQTSIFNFLQYLSNARYLSGTSGSQLSVNGPGNIGNWERWFIEDSSTSGKYCIRSVYHGYFLKVDNSLSLTTSLSCGSLEEFEISCQSLAY